MSVAWRKYLEFLGCVRISLPTTYMHELLEINKCTFDMLATCGTCFQINDVSFSFTIFYGCRPQDWDELVALFFSSSNSLQFHSCFHVHLPSPCLFSLCFMPFSLSACPSLFFLDFSLSYIYTYIYIFFSICLS